MPTLLVPNWISRLNPSVLLADCKRLTFSGFLIRGVLSSFVNNGLIIGHFQEKACLIVLHDWSTSSLFVFSFVNSFVQISQFFVDSTTIVVFPQDNTLVVRVIKWYPFAFQKKPVRNWFEVIIPESFYIDHTTRRGVVQALTLFLLLRILEIVDCNHPRILDHSMGLTPISDNSFFTIIWDSLIFKYLFSFNSPFAPRWLKQFPAKRLL